MTVYKNNVKLVGISASTANKKYIRSDFKLRSENKFLAISIPIIDLLECSYHTAGRIF